MYGIGINFEAAFKLAACGYVGMINKKKIYTAVIVGALGIALVVLTRPMARGGFLSYVLGIAILVGGVVGLQHLEEILSDKKKKRDDSEDE